MKAMVLAAGEGTRLRPLTLDTPKPMLEVGGRPTLEWILLWLRYHGIHEIVVNLCQHAEKVASHFGDGRNWGIRVAYSVEPEMLGTAGGIKRVEHLFDGPLVVAYGDVLTNMNLGRLIAHHVACGDRPHVTLSLARAAKPWECGVVAVDSRGRVTRFQEKPPRDQVFSDLTNAGVLVIDSPLLRYVPRDRFYDISSDLLPALLGQDVPIYAPPVEDDLYLIDTGTMENYRRAQREWPSRAVALGIAEGVRAA